LVETPHVARRFSGLWFAFCESIANDDLIGAIAPANLHDKARDRFLDQKIERSGSGAHDALADLSSEF